MNSRGREIHKVENEASFIKKLCEIIEQCSQEAISQRDCFTISVSGGSVVNMLVKGLPNINTTWSKWKVLFCDERLVPSDDKESTFGLYKTNLIPATPLEEQQFVSIDFSYASQPAEGASKAALDYEKKLREIFPSSSLTQINGKDYPRIDCLVLGMGPDGHTCSLFPGDSDSLSSNSWVIPITNSPKPPPCRITLSFPVLNSARIAVFPITGSSKADMVKTILGDDADLPANTVRPNNGTVHWILDQAASSLLN